jgi:hypothetical protein
MIVAEEEISQQQPNVVKLKRGRKSKKELMESLNLIDVERQNIKLNKPKKIKNNVTDNISNKSEKIIDECNTLDSFENKKLEENELKENEQLENEQLENEQFEENEKLDNNELTEPKVFKKRGRKPKGGKIIQQTSTNDEQIDEKQNVILHLKCSMGDLEEIKNGENEALDAYNTHIYNELMYNYQKFDEHKFASSLNQSNNNDDAFDGDDDDTDFGNKDNMKEIWKKLKQLEHNLHVDNISKKSACFWDTCEFDTPPIHIPKYFIGGTYYVYGCFCCPECAVAYLNNQQIDRSTKTERYQLLHDVYSKIYDYKKSIKEASDPRYLLDKFFGNLSIKEYRNLLRLGTLYLVIDKPLTKVYPEIHENTEDYILNNKIIPSNTSTYQIRGKNNKKKQNKTSILSENFGIN